MAKTLYDKIWDAHLVESRPGETPILYIDRHLVHEVTSPQAFEGLRTAGRKVRRPELTLAVADHNVPTKDRDQGITEPESRAQVEALIRNTRDFGVEYFAMDDPRAGIVHIIGPEQGWTLPGTTIVCGDSHTSTHGAFGALAFGIGTSDVEHVLATQTLLMPKSDNMRVTVNGKLPDGVTAKDIALAVIAKIGTAGGTGYVIEYAGDAVRALSMEGRMTLCNLTIEGGARAGLIAVDDTTIDYIKGRPRAPKAAAFEAAAMYWRTLKSDPDAVFDAEVTLDARDIVPMVTWGTSPEQALPITATVPDPAALKEEHHRAAAQRAIDYMGISAGMKLTDIKVDHVFIGSCTNGRIEDLRAAAAVARGRKVAAGVNAIVVPGSGLVKAQAEEEGLDTVFLDAGFEWRDPGCSMCLAMNPDKLQPGERCASTSNRNFEGRQGRGRAHASGFARDGRCGGGDGASDGCADALGAVLLRRECVAPSLVYVLYTSLGAPAHATKFLALPLVLILCYTLERIREIVMAHICVEDFKVDVEARRVKHKSGVEFSYYRRWNDEDWIDSGPSFVRNPTLYSGDYPELFFMGKIAAILNGMQRS